MSHSYYVYSTSVSRIIQSGQKPDWTNLQILIFELAMQADRAICVKIGLPPIAVVQLMLSKMGQSKLSLEDGFGNPTKLPKRSYIGFHVEQNEFCGNAEWTSL